MRAGGHAEGRTCRWKACSVPSFGMMPSPIRLFGSCPGSSGVCFYIMYVNETESKMNSYLMALLSFQTAEEKKHISY